MRTPPWLPPLDGREIRAAKRRRRAEFKAARDIGLRRRHANKQRHLDEGDIQ